MSGIQNQYLEALYKFWWQISSLLQSLISGGSNQGYQSACMVRQTYKPLLIIFRALQTIGSTIQ